MQLKPDIRIGHSFETFSLFSLVLHFVQFAGQYYNKFFAGKAYSGNYHWICCIVPHLLLPLAQPVSQALTPKYETMTQPGSMTIKYL